MKAIVCMNEMKGIGYRNRLPWRLKRDLDFFREVTMGKGNNAVIMGYKTFQSMGCRSLAKRRNYIITHNPQEKIKSCGADVVFESNIQNLLMLDAIFDEVFVIGGEAIYKLFEPYYQQIYVTHIKKPCPVDTFFLVDLKSYHRKLIQSSSENKTPMEFYVYTKKTPEEMV